MSKPEHRRAQRLLVDIPITSESIGQPPLKLHPALEPIYERVAADDQRVGSTVVGSIRDLSTNGAFITGEPLPLLSRVALRFALEELGQVDAIGWVLWRRSDDCTLERDTGNVTLARGFGVLFEALNIDARLEIHKMVTRAGTVSS